MTLEEPSVRQCLCRKLRSWDVALVDKAVMVFEVQVRLHEVNTEEFGRLDLHKISH